MTWPSATWSATPRPSLRTSVQRSWTGITLAAGFAAGMWSTLRFITFITEVREARTRLTTLSSWDGNLDTTVT
jgi:hypothetical protein